MKPSFRDLMVVIDCTSETQSGDINTINSFADHLANGRELTPYLRFWFINLLRLDQAQRFHLLFKRRVGRPKPANDPSDVVTSDDHLIFSHCTMGTKPNIEPLIEHFAAGYELTPFLRNWIVSMMRKERAQSHVLEYRVRGRRTSIERTLFDLELEARYWDLHGLVITEDFCADLETALHLDQAPPEVVGQKLMYRYGFTIRDDLGTWVKPMVQFVTGRKIGTSQIHHLLAAEFGLSLSTVKRTLSTHETARLIV
jgi:hypothetical protein